MQVKVYVLNFQNASLDHKRCSMKRTQSVCPIAKSLDIVGDKWSLLIIRDMFAGKTQYSEFMDSPEGISTNILATRLKHLEKVALITSRGGKRKIYGLTGKGRALYDVLDVLANWGLKYVDGTQKLIEI